VTILRLITCDSSRNHLVGHDSGRVAGKRGSSHRGFRRSRVGDSVRRGLHSGLRALHRLLSAVAISGQSSSTHLVEERLNLLLALVDRVGHLRDEARVRVGRRARLNGVGDLLEGALL